MPATAASTTTAYVWAYKVKPQSRAAFVRAYGPNGEWANFFSRSPGYVRTDLLADKDDENRFVTIDYFRDDKARGMLVEELADAYKAIDKRWEDATDEEVFIGAFHVAAIE